MLLFIIDDIVQRTAVGIDGWDHDGNRIKIFIDVVGYVSDYPALAHVLDVLGHNASASCPSCTFRRRINNEETAYDYTDKVHALNSSRCRCLERHEAIRKSGIEDSAATFLGLSKSSDTSEKSAPLL